ncbi:hypothetical protein E2C01_028729 [Portunus trituberculatus]|uniref:Uncharacterized protein n=1 Tax=Portunus trituberculatus TaxID=210409 RepID=A0A5B7EPV5_PORTR|nr:hypothetical protein [Portunus trituberculatus]
MKSDGLTRQLEDEEVNDAGKETRQTSGPGYRDWLLRGTDETGWDGSKGGRRGGEDRGKRLGSHFHQLSLGGEGRDEAEKGL